MKRSICLSVLLTCVLLFGCLTSVWAKGLEQDKLVQIEQYIKTHMDRFEIPGMSAVIVADGQVVFAKGFGVLKAGDSQQVNAYTDFQIASVSKNFTALAVMQLVEQGKINVNDPVTKYLPWFASKDSERSKSITVKNLLQHTSGIPTSAYGLEIKDGTMAQLEDQVKQISKINLTADPGTTHQYSNLNYWTLSLIVEKVSGMKFADYVDVNIFTPLEMTRSGYINKIEKLDNVAVGHRIKGGKSTVFDYNVPGTTIAAGGVYTNAMDMANYIIALLNNGTYKDHQIISPTGWNEMTTNGAKVWEHITYGYGWMTWETELGNYIQHGGDNPNYTADLYLIPEKNIGFALMSNSQHSITHGIARGIKDVIFDTEPLNIEETGAEAADVQMSKIISYVQYLFVAIMGIWLAIVLIGISKGRYTIFKSAPSVIRLVLQVIIVPIILLFVAFYLYKLPVAMIGSLYIALLYKADLVGTVLNLAITCIVFAGFIAVMGFVRKKNIVKKTKCA